MTGDPLMKLVSGVLTNGHLSPVGCPPFPPLAGCQAMGCLITDHKHADEGQCPEPIPKSTLISISLNYP